MSKRMILGIFFLVIFDVFPIPMPKGAILSIFFLVLFAVEANRQKWARLLEGRILGAINEWIGPTFGLPKGVPLSDPQWLGVHKSPKLGEFVKEK